MTEARRLREAVADGVLAGYSEARIGAGLWRGGPQRFWRTREQRVMTPQQAESVFDRIAGRYPGALVH